MTLGKYLRKYVFRFGKTIGQIHDFQRQKIGREIANLLIYKLPAFPNKTIEQTAWNYCGYLHDVNIFLEWDTKEACFIVRENWQHLMKKGSS
jgi:hypothetical protein